MSCDHFGLCGGCQLQDLPYLEQLRRKERAIGEIFSREIEPIVPCDPPWEYRNKMEFSFSQNKKGDHFLGLWMKRGRVLTLDMCALVPSWMIDVLHRIKRWWEASGLSAYHFYHDTGALRTLTMREGRRTGQKLALLTVSGHLAWQLDENQLELFRQALPDIDVICVRKQILEKGSPTRFEERFLTHQKHIQEILYDSDGRPWFFNIRPTSFFQPNTVQAEKIYQTALHFASLEQGQIVFDLYCGTGSLGIVAAPHVRKVVGIEQCYDAVHDANENSAINKVNDAFQIYQGDVGEVLPFLDLNPTLLFIDPPREGLSQKALKNVILLNAPKIVYISCNPKTQFLNCQELLAHGYHIEKIKPIDQFPHTPHIENIVLLTRL